MYKSKPDCIIVGHNEMNFTDYERIVGGMGNQDPAYRDLGLNYVCKNGKKLTLPMFYNEYFLKDVSKPFHLGNTFSATIAYLGSFLNRHGISFDFVNSFQHEKERLETFLLEKVKIFIITTTLYTSAFPIFEVVDYIKKHNKEALIIVGGPYVSTLVRTQDIDTVEYLFDEIGADFYINNAQGEKALVELILAIKQGKVYFDDINNLYFRNNKTYSNTKMVPEDNLLQQNLVDWHLFDGRLPGSVNLRTAISCPFNCKFCGFPEHAGKHQVLDIDAIEYELDGIKAYGTVQWIKFVDDTLNVPVKRFKELLKRMIKKKYNFYWSANLRCQFLDEESVALMSESGCKGVFLGIESGNDMILKNMRKNATVEQYLKGHELLRKTDILTFGSFIVGFPGETESTVTDTINFIRQTKPDFYRAQLWFCEPITPIWKERHIYNIEGSSFKWSHSTMDSEIGCNQLERFFFEIDESLWFPVYGFDMDGVFNLMQRGMSLEEIKRILLLFQDGIRQKITSVGATVAPMHEK